jgi:hypothetical protein
MQLASNKAAISTKAETLYNHYYRRGTRPNARQILELLRCETEKMSTLFVVVDALDECYEKMRENLVAEIRWLPANVYLLVTSSPLDTIAEEFEGILQLEIAAQNEDLKTYIENRIHDERHLAKTVGNDEALKQRITQTVLAKTQKMFSLPSPLWTRSHPTLGFSWVHCKRTP